ncbi:MAG TPA: hypothetical protein VFQ88_14000 [Nevskiaceae bacterium]|nr:hypothetical protein [Nevskiaceae bacterium]
MHFNYVVDLDERGSYRAHVEDPSGNSVLPILAGNELQPGETSIFEDGFMQNGKDMNGLADYLVSLDVIHPGDTVRYVG